MFRYGGPIKEGVMSGIREPKRNGGSMKAALVGHPAYPKTNGREHHGLPLAIWGGNLLRTAAWPFARQIIKNIPKYSRVKFTPGNISSKVHKGYPGSSGKGSWQKLGPSKETQKITEWQPTKFGKWFQADPMAGAVMSGKGFVGGTLKKGVGLGKYAFGTPSGLAFMGLPVTYYGGKYLLADGTELNDDQIKQIEQKGPPGGGDPGMYLTPEGGDPDANQISKQKEWNDRIQKYRDIMDIKGMNKQAAYKSLVDASKIIQESGDFKGDIRSGKLINEVIQAASKQFDKPGKTSDAINTLILQNELKKDLSAETDALDKLYKKGRIAVDQKALNPSKSDLVGAYAKSGVKGQNLYDNAAKELSANSGQTWRGNLIEDSEFKEILSDLKKNPKTQNVDDVTIIATWTQDTINKTNKNIPDGNYTVGSTIVTIKDKQVVAVE